MKVLDLFSGIGGFSLGLERAGMETVAFCEIDPFCQKVLRKHWPDVPIYDDVKTLTAEKLKYDGITEVSVLTGGYPCQPFSEAGKRKGEKDDRHLWPEMYRIIKSIKPTWIVAENVTGHISMGLDKVLSDLEAINYTWWAFVIPACSRDAPHRRDRVWIVGNSNSQRRRHRKGLGLGGVSLQNKGWQKSSDNAESSSEDVANTDNTRGASQRNNTNPNRAPEKQEKRNITQLKPCGRGENIGEPITWPAEPGVCRVVDGLPNRMDRVKSLGNAVIPQIPEIIGRAIMECEA